MDPKPSFDPEEVFPLPDNVQVKVKVESRHEEAKAIGEKRHLPTNEAKKGGMSLLATRTSKKPKK
jgi:hypothetical protein